ncbi:MAG TPA: polyketide synthase, partial [Sulfurovum sp.]|nr:polyketide synthase [Sulfurovum sp.]
TAYLRQRWPYVERVMKSAAADLNLSDEQAKIFIERSEEYYKSVFPEMTEDSLAGGLSNTIAGRVCNTMDLHGGGYTVDGACSSSLIAISTAAEKLSSGTLDLAIAGGVDVSLDTFEMVGFARTGALTPDKMRVYDKRGNGFMPGEGCGLIVMKRLEDAKRDGDKIYATIKGWGMSSDGKGGMTAPSGKYQALALQRAYDMAGYSAKDLDFIEGHGTGTTVGDREEIKGIAINIGTEPKNDLRSCGLTSFKSISGHTKAASGIAGLIKATLALNQRIIPPTAGCEQPNLSFNEPEGKGLYPILLGEKCDPSRKLRAGVSAMGFGGINTHITLESADAPFEELKSELPTDALLVTTQKSEVYPLAADSVDTLITLVQNCLLDVSGRYGDPFPGPACLPSRGVKQWNQGLVDFVLPYF